MDPVTRGKVVFVRSDDGGAAAAFTAHGRAPAAAAPRRSALPSPPAGALTRSRRPWFAIVRRFSPALAAWLAAEMEDNRSAVAARRTKRCVSPPRTRAEQTLAAVRLSCGAEASRANVSEQQAQSNV